MELTKKEFTQFVKSQSELVNTLNHKVTKIETDVNWIKKLLFITVGVMISIFIAVVTKGV